MARSKKRASLGVLFWIAFILFILVVFLFNRSNIETVLERTQLVDVVRDRVGLEPRQPDVEITAPDSGEEIEESRESASEQEVELVVRPEEEAEPSPDPPIADTEENDAGTNAGEDSTAGSRDESVAPETDDDPTEIVVAPQPRPNTRTARIYFIRVTDEGRIIPQQVERKVHYRDSPMTETLRILLEGPTADELNLGLLNLIPDGTQLLSAAVRDGTAFLNFNEAFKFNTMGAEGTIAQLQQIVFSSTEFSTVRSVQILIEGKRLDYLGGEGIYIGEPLTRSAFG